MNYDMRFLQPSDLDIILQYERKKARLNTTDEEAMFAEWQASWRQESLEFYLPNGWCFGIFDDAKSLIGYFLAQPILFFQGHMQSLWVEHISSDSLELKQKLVEVAYKTSREKHLQKLLLKASCVLSSEISMYQYKENPGTYFELATTKMDVS
ncbi:MAG: hypothetical protein KDD37_11005 [Bdellovibrionales bacterium]|nr:hypothetical protein [Bdellovibrionales bacterium]